MQKIWTWGSVASILLLAGCKDISRRQVVFGPARENELSVSLDTLGNAFNNSNPAATKKTLENMSKEELIKALQETQNKSSINQQKQEGKTNTKSEKIGRLSFPVKNATGQTIFVTCFSYLQKHPYSSWRWDKSPICKIRPNETCIIEIDEVYNKHVEKEIFGYLGIFDSKEQAEESTYELLDDSRKLDLDLLYKIGNNTVVIEVEKYGVEKQIFDYKLTGEQIAALGFQPELDFFVENKTGKKIFVTCFVYEQQEDSSDFAVWKYTKTPVQALEKDEIAIIDVASIRDEYQYRYMRGTLGIFEANEELLAENSTFQLLPEEKKIKLDRLSNLRGKKVVLKIEKYGSKGDFIDFTIKTQPRRKIGEKLGE